MSAPIQYLRLDGTSGTFASTPDSAALSVTGDIDIRCRVALDDWANPSIFQTLMAKWTDASGQNSFLFDVSTAGNLRLVWTEDGSSAKAETSSVATGFTDGTAHWVRVTLDVDNGSGDAEVEFFTSDDGDTWTQLGTTQLVGAITSIFDGDRDVTIGDRQGGSTQRVTGNVFYAEVRDGIDGTVVANPRFYVSPWDAGDSSNLDAAGNTWTLNGNATIVEQQPGGYGDDYGNPAYAGLLVSANEGDTSTHLAVEVAFDTNALTIPPLWTDVTDDVRQWNVRRGRRRELERFQPARATVVLDNLDRDYDSQNDASPHFGNLRPMRRMRIRETFNGVTYPIFDGFVDSWKLHYPHTGKDATATLTATDAGKLFARTNLGRSVWSNLIESEEPTVWYRLDETKGQASDANLRALNSGTAGSTDDGTFEDTPQLGASPIVVHDPGGSMKVADDTVATGVGLQGVDTPLDILNSTAAFAVEAWCVPESLTSLNPNTVFAQESGSANAFVEYSDLGGGNFSFQITDSTGLANSINNVGGAAFSRNHVVAKYSAADGTINLWVNGDDGAGPFILTNGSFGSTGTTLKIGHRSDTEDNFNGTLSNVIVYQGAAAEAIDEAFVDAHTDAGVAPWNGDTPKERLERALDAQGWPDSLRQLDTGDGTFQSAEITGQTVQEHMQKVAETEFGLLFMARNGNVRFVQRSNRFGAESKGTFSDDGAGLEYRDIDIDDGDDVIRNRATISALNEPDQTATSTASIDEFGRFQYTLDDLLHDSLTHSQSYADFIVAEYGELRRRVTRLELGPTDDPDLLHQMLQRELGDVVTVEHTPPGGGDQFTQECVIEGINHSWQPNVNRTVRWELSPTLSTANEF